MKHLTVFVIGLALAIFLLGANAKMQQDTANLLRDGKQTATSNRDAYISSSSSSAIMSLPSSSRPACERPEKTAAKL